MTDSVRERVVAQIEAKLKAMTALANNGITFQFVERTELDRTKKYMGNAASVLDLEESYVYQTCYLQCTLRVGIEYWYQVPFGAKPRKELGKVLAELKKLFGTDTNLVEDVTGLQLAENIQLAESDFDVEGPADKVVSGYFQIDVTYRTDKQDPYVLR